MRDNHGLAQVRRDETGEWEVAFRAGYTTILGGGHGPAITIPNVVKVDGRHSPVRVIGARAFRGRSLTSAVLPETLVVIDGLAFEHNNLTTVEIPSSVTTVADFAFHDNRLVEVQFSRGVKWIGGWAFAENELRRVALPDSVEGIYRGAFAENELERIDFAGTVRTIEAEAFASQYCSRTQPVSVIELHGEDGAVWNGVTVPRPMSIAGAPAQVRPGRRGRSLTAGDQVTAGL